MTHRAVRVIPKLSDRGILSIPMAAWEPIRAQVASQFDAVLHVHHHQLPGAYHGDAPVPVPHYLLELLGDDLDQMDAAKDMIDEFVEALVRTHINTESTTPSTASDV